MFEGPGMNVEQWYPRLPIALQDLAVSVEGWRIQRRRFGVGFAETLAEVRRRGRWSKEETIQFRDRRIAAFVEHAAKHVPFYQQRFAELGLQPDEIRGLADLSKLPVLTKAEVQAETSRFIAPNINDARMIHAHTSGTTGGGLQFPVTLAAHQEQFAIWWRYRDRHGLDSTEPCLYFGGRSVVPLQQTKPPYWRSNRPGRQLLFSGYHLSQQTASDYLDAMERSRCRWIHGYPSLVSLLAHFAVQANRKLPMRWVTLGAESLFPQQAAVIEAAFGVTPLQHYGMAEQVANISQCPEGALHVDEDFAAIEFDRLETGEYRILGTNLANPAFPLIRYDVGDVVTLSDSSCGCGLPGRIVERIDGRKEDFVVTKSGALLGRLDHIFKDMIHIREAQILQHQAGRMTLCIVKGPGFTEDDERQLRDETRKRTGREIDFDIQYYPQLPRTKSGKLRFVVSTVRSGGLTSALQMPNRPAFAA